jgi:hypothetical protein
MRALNALVLAGVSLLLGFTFYEDVPGKQAGSALIVPGVDLSRNAYLAAQDVIGARVRTARSAAFPSAWTARTHVKRQPDGTFVVRSWVDTQESSGLQTRSPWTAYVKCETPACQVMGYELNR